MRGTNAADDAVQAAVESYRRGDNRRTACAKHGVSPEKLRAALKEAGVAVRPRWPAKPEKGSGDGIDSVASLARFRVVRLSDGEVLSGGPVRDVCLRQCAVINTYTRIAEVRP